MDLTEKSQTESLGTSDKLTIDPPRERSSRRRIPTASKPKSVEIEAIDESTQRKPRRRKRSRGMSAASGPRARMMQAMLASIGEQGYPRTVVADVIARATASRKTFYEQFEDKQDCFLAMADEAIDDWLYRVESALESAEEPRDVVGAFVQQLFDLALEAPAELRVLTVELIAAGPAGMERRENLLGRLAAILARALGGTDPQGGELRARTIVGALLRMLYARARRGERVRKPRRRELLELAPLMEAWVCSYVLEPETEPMPPSTNGVIPVVPVGGRAPGTLSLSSRSVERRGLPRGDSNVSRSFVVHNQRERIIDALANLSATKGYGTATIPQIVQEAAVSVQAFYEHFSGKEDVLLVAYEIGHRKALAIVERSYEAHEDWPTAVGAGVNTLLGFLASESAYAHLALVDVWNASATSATMAQAALKSYAGLLEPRMKGSGATVGAQAWAEATAWALLELCFLCTVEERARELPALGRFATDMALRPFTDVRPY